MKPSCAVNGSIAPGCMCGRILVGLKLCGAELGTCKHQVVSCNYHPDAPHGFDRDASHQQGRYVCECEGWKPENEE